MKGHLKERDLIQYQFELASKRRMEEISGHLELCQECQSRLQHIKQTFSALNLLREEIEVSDDLLKRVTEQARQPVRRRRHYRLAPAWIGAAAAVLLIASLYFAAVLNIEKAPQVTDKVAKHRGKPTEIRKEKGDIPVKYVKAQKPTPSTAETPPEPAEAGISDIDISEKPPFAPASAIELVTLPKRENVQLTIYNSTFAGTSDSRLPRRYGGSTGGGYGGYGSSGYGRRPGSYGYGGYGKEMPSGGDLTLVREKRNLTLKRGWNWLQFMWAGTLIDPTSLHLEPKEHRDKIDIEEMVYPARLKDVGRWLIRSQVSGQVPFEITYFTSGMTWRAFYMGTLSEDEKTMQLKAYVRVDNRSGEDYENAQTRLIVGKVHILDQIVELARRQSPYGRPVVGHEKSVIQIDRDYSSYGGGYGGGDFFGLREPKEIRKEALSEYFLYTIEGTETIPANWSKRLQSFEKDEVPVVNLYKYEQQRYGDNVIHFLSFENNKEHKLGDTPIPGGLLKVFRTADASEHLSYVGQSSFKYIPVDEEVELNLGTVDDIVVEPKLMDYKTENYKFDSDKDITGWDEIHTFKIEVRNTRSVPVEVEIKRNFDTQYWDISRTGDFGEYEKYDLDTVKFTLTLKPRSARKFGYVLRTYHGERQDDWTEALSGISEEKLTQNQMQKAQVGQTEEQSLVVRIADKTLPCGIGRVKKNSAWNEPYRYVFYSYPEYIDNCQHIFMRQEGGGATGRWFRTGQIEVSKPCWLYAAVYNPSNQQRQIWKDEGWEILPEILQDLGDPRRKPRPVRDYTLMRKHISERTVSFDTKAEKTNMVIWIFK